MCPFDCIMVLLAVKAFSLTISVSPSSLTSRLVMGVESE